MRFVSTKSLAALALITATMICVVRAQDQFAFPSAKDLDRAFNDTYRRRTDILRGDSGPLVKADDKVAEATAQYYIYRVAHAGSSFDATRLDQTRLQKDFEGFADDVARAKSDGAKKFAAQLAPQFVACLKQLLDRDIRGEPQLVIFGSMMLPGLGRMRQEQGIDYLISLIQNPKTHEVIRLNALKAMRESMPIASIDKDTDLETKGIVARIDFDSKIVAALTKYIEQPRKLKGDPESIAVLRFVRREAITSLASAGVPAVAALNKKLVFRPIKREFQHEGFVAPTLLRVMAEQISPPPTLQEKLEAAYGACNLAYPKMPDYNPQLAIYLVGRTLEDLVKDYNQDLVNFAGGGDKKLPLIGYKTEAKRFQTGLASLAENAKNSPAKGNADKLVSAFAPLLKSMTTYSQTEQAKLNDAVKLVNSLRPKDGLVFGSAKATVNLQ